jgi:hypothetical protein
MGRRENEAEGETGPIRDMPSRTETGSNVGRDWFESKGPRSAHLSSAAALPEPIRPAMAKNPSMVRAGAVAGETAAWTTPEPPHAS